MEVDNWQSSYEAAERLHRSIVAEIGDRGRLPRSSVGYNSSTARLRSMLADLTTAITSLRSALASLGPQLSSGELSRRRDLVENLSRRAGQVRDQVADGGPLSRADSARRSQLLEDLGTTSWGATPGNKGAAQLPPDPRTSRRVLPNRTGVRENETSTGVATGSLRSDQDRLLAEQEEGLDLLGDIIRRQKGMGEDIFREVTQQNDLIDEIDDRVENVNQRLLTTSNNIAVVTRKDRTCGYWIVILILAIAIVTIIFA